MKEDVKKAVDCGVKNIVVEIPSSEHIFKYAYKWELEKAIELSIEATLFAKENGLESGIIAAWYQNANDIAPLELSPYLYSLTGHPEATVVLGKNSGVPNVDFSWISLG